jgi:AAA+ ATPase superfamily predicted ATPase
MYKLISRSFSEFIKKFGGLKDQFTKFLSRLRGVSIAGIEVNFSWSPRERPLLTEILDMLNDFAERVVERLVVVFDEMQSVRGSIGFVLQNALAHSYDFNKNICIVLAGSEMGILYNILQNPGNPLYGRAYVEVRTRKLSYSEAVDFLSKGFAEVGIAISREEIEDVVRELDGIIGWLTYYGYLRSRGLGDLEYIVREAVVLAKKELESFLATRVSNRYRVVLKLLAKGVKEWGKFKDELEKIEKRSVSDRVLHDILRELRRHSIVDENNEFTDPIYRKASLEL